MTAPFLADALLLGRYQLKTPLRQEPGRMVWRAYDRVLAREVVLKGTYGPESEPNATPKRAPIVDEFRRLKRLAHPQLVPAFDLHRVWVDVGPRVLLTFFTQPWQNGPSAYDLRGKLSDSSVTELAITLLELVAWLHQQGLRQLDLKSEHWLRVGGRWMLIDLDQARPEDPLAAAHPHGTPAYLAPELLDGSPGSAQADLFSVGVILYEVRQGRRPGEDDPPQLPAPSRLQSPSEPSSLARLMDHLLEARPEARPSSADVALEALGHVRPTEVGPWRITDLLEREQALHRIQALLMALTSPLQTETVLPPTASVVLTGPPGSGRSHLLKELAQCHQEQGISTLLLDQQNIGSEPLSTVECLWRWLLSLGGQTLTPLLLPKRESRHPEQSGTREEMIVSALSQLSQAAVTARARQQTPALLLLDDVESLDELSREVLMRLQPSLPELGLLLVCTAPPPSEWQTSAHEEVWRGAEHIALGPLSREGVRTLAEQLLGPGGLDRVQMEDLYAQTAGLAGAVRDALLASGGRAASRRDTRCLPENGRLASLPDTLTHLLQLAAVLSEALTIKRLVALAQAVVPGTEGEEPEPVSDAHVHTLLARGFLARSAHDPEQLHFVRRSEQQSLLEQLPPPLRATRHQQCAELLEREELAGLPVSSEQLGHHFLAAHRPERARPHLRTSYRVAIQSCCFEAAARTLRQLIVIEGKEAGELWLQLGKLEQSLGRPQQAREAFEAAIATARSSSLEMVHCQEGLGWSLACLGDLTGAKTVLMAAVYAQAEHAEACHPRRSPAERARLLQRLAWVQLRQGELTAARQTLEAAISIELPLQSGIRWELSVYDVWLELEAGTMTGTVADSLRSRLQKICEATREAGHRAVLLMGLNLLSRLEHKQGRLNEAQLCLEEVVALSRQQWDLAREAAGVTNLATIVQELGNAVAALTHLRRAAAIQAQLGNVPAQLGALLSMANLLIHNGNAGAARLLLTQSEALIKARTSPEDFVRSWFTRLSASLSRLEGRTEGLDPILAGASTSLLAAGQPTLALEAQLERMSLAIEETRLEDAMRLIQEATATVQRVEEVRLRARFYRLAAEVHRAMEARLLAAVAPPTSTALLPTTSLAAAKTEMGSSPVGPGTPALSFDWLQALERVVQSSHDESALAASLAQLLGERFGGRGMVLLFDLRGVRRLQTSGVEPLLADELSESVLEQVRSARQTLVCPDILLHKHMGSLRSLREGQVRSLVCVPLPEVGARGGVVYVDHREPGRLTGPEVVREIERVATLAAYLLREPSTQDGMDDQNDDLGLIGTSEPIRLLRRELRRLAASSNPRLRVLITGEVGTGKSFVARILHRLGRRQTGPFESINCGAIPATLVEAELFGVERGAATAIEARAGCLERSTGGVLLLDELGDLPLEQQQKFLLVLTEHTFKRLGGGRARPFDAWLIGATTRDLRELVEEKRFRGDLLSRLWSNRLELPSLRARGAQDITLLLQHKLTACLASVSGEVSMTSQTATPAYSGVKIPLTEVFTRKALQFLLYEYHWPWNVRELESLFENEEVVSLIHTRGTQKVERPTLERVLWEGDLRAKAGSSRRGGGWIAPPPADATLKELHNWFEELKMSHFKQVIEQCGGNIAKAARQLGCDRGTLYDAVKAKHVRG